MRPDKPGSANQCWDFAKEMAIGDKIIARKGIGKIVGFGEVISPYQFDETLDRYKNVRKIKWEWKGEKNWEQPQLQFDTVVKLQEHHDSYKPLHKLIRSLPTSTRDWSETELEASVDAYLKMLKWETEGTKYVKSKINAELRDGPLSSRTKGSVEFRMQNISAVMQELGITWIKGYKPAANVGEKVKANIKNVIIRRDEISQEASKPSADYDEYRRRSDVLRKLRSSKFSKSKPQGNREPKANTITSKQYYRDPKVRAWVLELSNGDCEACGEAAPFSSEDGSAFLEIHHMKRLADDGPDVVENAVAICPNCHRRLHYSADRSEFADRVFENVGRLKMFK